MSGRVLVSTYSSRRAAEEAARRFVTEGLAACANMLAIRSVYRWRGKVEEADECLVLLKTTARRLPALRRALLASHPYEVPEAMVLQPASISRSYLRWLGESVR